MVGNELGKASRCYAQGVSGGPPRPVTPAGTTSGHVSPDGQQILYSIPGGAYFIQLDGEEKARSVPGLTADDEVIRWSADGRALDVFRAASMPFRIERLDIVSGVGRRQGLRVQVCPGGVAALRRGGRAVRMCFGVRLRTTAPQDPSCWM